jgi:ribose/xylose/arabinose/galactoside ABC-type transport system permease subunit
MSPDEPVTVAAGAGAPDGDLVPARDAGGSDGVAHGGEGRTVRSTLAGHRSEAVLGLVLLAIGAFATTQSDVFLTWGNWKTVLIQASFVGILSCGMTVLMVAGAIDLSVGAGVSFASMILGLTVVDHGFPVGLAIVLAILAAAVVGVANGVLAANSIAHPFILTLGTMTLLTGASLLISTEPIIGFPEGLVNAMTTAPLGIPLVALIFAGVALACHFLLSRAVVGRHLFALGGSSAAARLAGVRIGGLTVGIFALMGLLVGVTAVLMTATLGSAGPQSGQGMELTAIAAVAVGGTPLQGGRGSILGTVLGLLLIVTIGNVLNLLDIDPNLQNLFVGGIIVFAVMAQGRRKAA